MARNQSVDFGVHRDSMQVDDKAAESDWVDIHQLETVRHSSEHKCTCVCRALGALLALHGRIVYPALGSAHRWLCRVAKQQRPASIVYCRSARFAHSRGA